MSITFRHCIATLFLVMALGVRAQASNELLNYQENTKLPSFSLPNLKGGEAETFDPSSGKPSVLMFFSLSPTFREQRSLGLAEAIGKLSTEFGDRVHFAAIFCDEQGLETVKRYITDKVISIRVLNDSKRQVYNQYGVFMIPLAIMIAGDGTLHGVVPYTANSGEMIGNTLRYLLGEWTKERWQDSLKPQQNVVRSKEEQEYVRRVNYGRVMLSKKMFASALRELMTASKILPKSIEAHVGIGQVHFASERFDLAEASYRTALEIDKESDEALAGLGLVLYRKGAMDKAIPILENAMISANPQVEVILTLAEFYEKSGSIDKAMRLNKLAVSRLIKRNEE